MSVIIEDDNRGLRLFDSLELFDTLDMDEYEPDNEDIQWLFQAQPEPSSDLIV